MIQNIEHESREENSASKLACPRCGQMASKVKRRTLEALLVESARSRLQNTQHFFCGQSACEIVYFATEDDQVYSKSDLNVRVGAKETEAPVPVCYCFGHTLGSIRKEIEEQASSTAVEEIRGEIAAGNCECDLRNPSGKCCLGDVTRAVKGIEESLVGRFSPAVGVSIDKDQGGDSTCDCCS